MTKPLKTISVKLPAELDRELTELARRRSTSRSALLRDAVEALTREHRRSVGELAGDLAGSLEGPDDLSCAAEHMDMYGSKRSSWAKARRSAAPSSYRSS